MVNRKLGKMFFRLFYCISIFLAAGCAMQKKIVDSYQEKPAEPASAEHAQAASSKSLPAVNNLPPQDFGSGRIQPQETETAAASRGILPALTLVDDRIIAYERKLQAWREFSSEAAAGSLQTDQQEKIADCRLRIQNILSGYNELHELLLEASSGDGGELTSPDKFAAVEREDISFLESECQQLITLNRQSGSWLAKTKSRLIEEKEVEIAEAAGRNDYNAVVAVYEAVPAEDRSGFTIEATYQYGRALLRTGKARQAGQVLQDLLAGIRRESRIQHEFEIMKTVADIYFGLEDYSRAFERYADIVNRYQGFGDKVEWAHQQQSLISARDEKRTEVKSFADLLLSYLTYNPVNDGYKVAILARNFTENYPDSPLSATASRMFMESRDKADAWFTGVLSRIERYRAEGQYEEGLAFIEQLPRINLLPEKQDRLRILTDEMIAARFETAETMRMEKEKELEETWNTALAHLRDREYEAAIEGFSMLLESPYGERARMQIEEASQLAVQENRRQAAELFVRANRATDLNTKIELLLESRRLLLNILEKYPRSELVDKVKRNLNRIEEEIAVIDPNLLSAAGTGNFPGENISAPDQLPADNTPPVSEDGQESSPQTGDDPKEKRL